MKIARLFDLAAICVTFFASFALSSAVLTRPSLTELLLMRIKVANLLLFVGYLALCSAVFSACGFYRSHRLSHWRCRIAEILLAVTFVAGALWGLRRPLALTFATDAFVLWFWLLTCGMLVPARAMARRLLRFARLHGRNLRNVVVVGEGPHAAALADRMRRKAGLGYRVLRIIDAGEATEHVRLVGDR